MLPYHTRKSTDDPWPLCSVNLCGMLGFSLYNLCGMLVFGLYIDCCIHTTQAVQTPPPRSSSLSVDMTVCMQSSNFAPFM